MVDQFIERRIIIGLIASTDFIKEIFDIFDSDLLQSESAATIGKWCIRYYKKHNKAPQNDIEIIFGSYKRRNALRKDDLDGIGNILESLSDEFVEVNFDIDILVDETIIYFEEQRINLLAEDLKTEVSNGNIEEARAQIAKFKPFQKTSRKDSDFFADDPKRTEKVFSSVCKPIIEYPGRVGWLSNRHLVTGGLLGFLGQEKVGKTWILFDIGFQAIRNSRNVAFFAAGDMNRQEMELRKYIYLAKRSNEKEYCKELYIPIVDCWKNQNGSCINAPGLAPFLDEKYPKNWEKEKYFSGIFEDNIEHEICTEC